MMRYLLVFFLVACTAPGQLNRGTPVVRPSARRPGVGAPRYDNPPPPRPSAKATPPRAVIVTDPAPILGWTPPKNLNGGPDNDGLPAHCAERANEQISESSDPDLLDSLDPQARRCLAATTWAQCIEAFLLDFDKARRASDKTSRAFWDYAKIGAHVRKLVRAECAGIGAFDRYIWRGP